MVLRVPGGLSTMAGVLAIMVFGGIGGAAFVLGRSHARRRRERRQPPPPPGAG